MDQFRTQLSYVGIMYFMLINASYPPVCSSNSNVYSIKSPKFKRFLWLYSILSPMFWLLFLKMFNIGNI